MKKCSKIFSVITTVIVVLIVLIALLLAGTRIIGIDPYIVLSGSMEPKYHVGSMIYVKRADPADLEVGDPITFKVNDNTLATHEIVRIVENDPNNPGKLGFKTKGLANEEEDGGTVWSNQIVGKPIFSIPYLGYVSAFLKTTAGITVIVAVVILLLILVFLPDVLKKSEPPKDREEKNEENGKDEIKKG